MFGFGKSEEELASGPAGAYSIFARCLHQITDLLCEELHLPHDGTAFSYEFEPATQDYEDKVIVRKGTMAGLLMKASTTLGDTAVATVEMRFFANPGWPRDPLRAGSKWTSKGHRVAGLPMKSTWRMIL